MMSLLITMCSVLSGCQNEASSECKTPAYCEGNTRYYCEAGSLQSEVCSESCINGACSKGQACIPDYCEQNVRHYCSEIGIMTSETCDEGCEQGECIKTKTCVPDYCEGNTRFYCNEAGVMASEACKTMCASGTCLDASECVEAYCDGNIRHFCGDHDAMQIETCPGKCSPEACLPLEPGCGDGVLGEDEACDDGDRNGQYGFCRSDCRSVSACGDGIVDAPDEVCDDGASNGQDGHCKSDCQGVAGCGNGVVENSEECDPPSVGPIVTCDATCKRPALLFSETPQPGHVTTAVADKCVPSDLFQKYLHYRERFMGNAAKHIPGFISWGTNPGESLPSDFRDPLMNCASAYMFNHGKIMCEFNDLSDAQGGYKWTDTTLWLGIMVHWLSTEYRVYQILGLDTSETAKYLAFAIKAFDRLDEEAEKLFGMEPKQDGFFIRDDIPRDFYTKDGEYRFVRKDNGLAGYECSASDYACATYKKMSPEDMLKGGFFVSQDQLTGLFEGFGMAAFLLPDDAEFEGMKLRHESLTRVHRIIQYLKEHTWLIGIKTSSGWQQVPEGWGGYVQMFSGLFAEAANTIVGNELGVEDYHDDASRLAKNVTDTLLNFSWPQWETNNNYNRNLALRLMNFTQVWDENKYMEKSISSGREIWPLDHAIVYGKAVKDEYPLWHIHTLLSQAPCDGPCSGDACQAPTPGWMGEHYFISPNDRFGSIYHDGEYNGLDYLILHNLYFLNYANKTGRPYTQTVTPMPNSKHMLQDVIQNKISSSKYVIADNTADMTMQFCGIPFADWVRDNTLGMVDIYVNDNRWTCGMDGICNIAKDPAPYTHRNALILGTEQADTIRVPKGYHHCIETFGGDDDIEVGEGLHHIVSGSGNDKIKANGYQVMIVAGAGDDTITLGSGYHMVDAGDGNDTIEGGSGTNLIQGGPGNDIIHANEGNNIIRGGAGNDVLEAGDGNNAVWGEDGDDKIRLGNGDNRIWPGDGRAFIKLGNGNSTLVVHEPQDDDLSICFGSGKNTIWAGWSSQSHCSAAQNSQLNDSCVSDLSESDCALSAYNAWK